MIVHFHFESFELTLGHSGNGVNMSEYSEDFGHSLFDYPRKLAKLRQAFIGAVHEDTVEMLAANEAIEKRTADWVYRSSDQDIVREFNRLAAALVDRYGTCRLK